MSVAEVPESTVFIGARRMLNRKERRAVDELRKRTEWLRRKILERESRGERVDYFTAEMAAMEWAVMQLAETPENDRVRETLKTLERSRFDRGTDE